MQNCFLSLQVAEELKDGQEFRGMHTMEMNKTQNQE